MGLCLRTGASSELEPPPSLCVCYCYKFFPQPQRMRDLSIVQHLDGSCRPPAMCGEPTDLVVPGWGDGLKQL